MTTEPNVKSNDLGRGCEEDPSVLLMVGAILGFCAGFITACLIGLVF